MEEDIKGEIKEHQIMVCGKCGEFNEVTDRVITKEKVKETIDKNISIINSNCVKNHHNSSEQCSCVDLNIEFNKLKKKLGLE